MSRVIVYATDEDIAVRAPGDFAALSPAHQVIASGTDGVTSGATLYSASASFLVAGIASGSIVSLSADATGLSPTLMAVDSATSTTLTLRRIGSASDAIGQPFPANSGIAYECRTFGPQIEDASYDLDRRYGIDANFLDRSPSILYDLRELRQATVLSVLVRQYTSEARGDSGDWAAKLKLARADLGDLLDRLTVRWGFLGASQAPSSRFNTRITR
jgi:hypothetical protein